MSGPQGSRTPPPPPPLELQRDEVTLARRKRKHAEMLESLIQGRSGPKPILSNLVTILQASPGTYPLSHDEMSGHALLRDEHVQDRHVIQLCLEMEALIGSGIARATMHDAVAHVAWQERFHPLRDKLARVQWDGTPRIDTYAVEAFGDDTTAAREAMRTLFLQAVKRIREPGCQADYMVVLIGGQGLCKTSWIKAQFGDEWVAELSGQIDESRAPMHLAGRWCLEFAELAALRKADVESVKAFVTCSTDKYRPPYGRAVICQPRQCVFVGTTNDPHPLKDATGNRRFLPVHVRKHVDVDHTRATAWQVWAEAAVRLDAGEQSWPTKTEEMEAAQEAAYDEDSWGDPVTEWLKLKPPTFTFTSADVAEDALQMPIGRFSRADQMRVGQILRRLGYARTRVQEGGNRVYRWSKPSGGRARGR